MIELGWLYVEVRFGFLFRIDVVVELCSMIGDGRSYTLLDTLLQAPGSSALC